MSSTNSEKKGTRKGMPTPTQVSRQASEQRPTGPPSACRARTLRGVDKRRGAHRERGNSRRPSVMPASTRLLVLFGAQVLQLLPESLHLRLELCVAALQLLIL